MADSNIDALSVFAPEHNQRHSVKSHVVNYWSQRAEDFAELHNEEFASDKHNQWLNEILPLLPHGHGLRILDVGTGSGFLALILAEQGHMVSGIDLTPLMILEARHAARDLGLTVDFQVMDAENTTFEPETFDCIVTRNLTWTLPHLDQAYTHWYNLLKSGGCLINFDGDYCHEKPLAELPERFRYSLDGEDHTAVIQEMQWTPEGCVSSWRPVRPIPTPDTWFENVWRAYRDGDIYQKTE